MNVEVPQGSSYHQLFFLVYIPQFFEEIELYATSHPMLTC